MVKEKNKVTHVKSHYLEHETNIETEGAAGLIDSKIFHTTDVGFKLRNLHIGCHEPLRREHWEVVILSRLGHY
jgi:hypothetical protein